MATVIKPNTSNYILQINKELNKDINKYGCFFMSILGLANKINGNDTITNIEKITKFYAKCVEKKLIGDECYILNAKEIIRNLGVNCTNYTKAGSDYKPQKNQQQILLFYNSANNFYHFVLGDEMDAVIYDPIGQSITVKYGILHTKRIFTIS